MNINSEQKGIIIRVVIFVIIAFVAYQFVLGTFIRRSCDDKALDKTVRAITPELYSNPGDLSFVQSIYRSLQYHECINKFMLLNLDGKHNIL